MDKTHRSIVTGLPGPGRARAIQDMFARIAPHYERMNRLMTAGQDRAWRRQVIRRLSLQPGDSLLDLGAGTGDLAREALRQQPLAHVTAADFTLEMMRLGQQTGPRDWCAADALRLPFAGESFQAVASGFLMRNVIDVDRALREQYRVLQPGGRIVILDTTPPHRSLLSPMIWLHMHLVIPALGGMFAGSRQAYTYLPDSTERFLSAKELASHMAAAGFKNVGFKILMFGTIAIHWGEQSH
jgi:demethylmenaquinone methyltransferase / 2-methoxy-6-polyprenyl-1,4-benzoquinol methylase